MKVKLKPIAKRLKVQLRKIKLKKIRKTNTEEMRKVKVEEKRLYVYPTQSSESSMMCRYTRLYFARHPECLHMTLDECMEAVGVDLFTGERVMTREEVKHWLESCVLKQHPPAGSLVVRCEHLTSDECEYVLQRPT